VRGALQERSSDLLRSDGRRGEAFQIRDCYGDLVFYYYYYFFLCTNLTLPPFPDFGVLVADSDSEPGHIALGFGFGFGFR
jgi:hypothetical protein